LDKLGPRKLDTQEVAVVFDPDAGRSILGLLASCVNGGAVWRKGSYLQEREGQLVASSLVNVVDDPLRVRGPGSRPFDGEGLLSRRNVIVEGGVLKSFVLDTYSAKKLGKESTANASRGSGGGVGPATTNLLLQPGAQTVDALLKSTDRAFYVTDMMGFGFNVGLLDRARPTRISRVRSDDLAEPRRAAQAHRWRRGRSRLPHVYLHAHVPRERHDGGRQVTPRITSRAGLPSPRNADAGVGALAFRARAVRAARARGSS
jgi:PmbA protein